MYGDIDMSYILAFQKSYKIFSIVWWDIQYALCIVWREDNLQESCLSHVGSGDWSLIDGQDWTRWANLLADPTSF